MDYGALNAQLEAEKAGVAPDAAADDEGDDAEEDNEMAGDDEDLEMLEDDEEEE